jgi:hypothetical protein
VLQVATESLEDAECIADALAKHEPQIECVDGSWVLVLTTTSERVVLPALLGALKACLDEHAIPMVKVTLDGRTYTMQGALGEA